MTSRDEGEVPYEYELLTEVVGLRFEVIERHVAETPEDLHVRLTCRVREEAADDEEAADEDDVDVGTFAFGLVYAFGVLSFHDARPRGISGIDFQEKDSWTVPDMLRHLRFQRGELHFYADYVRGRMMKTTVRVQHDGTVILDTVHRGRSAERWITMLEGKKPLSLVGTPIE